MIPSLYLHSQHFIFYFIEILERNPDILEFWLEFSNSRTFVITVYFLCICRFKTFYGLLIENVRKEDFLELSLDHPQLLSPCIFPAELPRRRIIANIIRTCPAGLPQCGLMVLILRGGAVLPTEGKVGEGSGRQSEILELACFRLVAFITIVYVQHFGILFGLRTLHLFSTRADDHLRACPTVPM